MARLAKVLHAQRCTGVEYLLEQRMDEERRDEDAQSTEQENGLWSPER